MGSRVLAVKAAVAISMNGDRVTLLDLDHLDRPPVVLEGSAAAVWRAVDGTSTDDELCADLADAYGVTAGELAGDVLALLDDLLARELLIEV